MSLNLYSSHVDCSTTCADIDGKTAKLRIWVLRGGVCLCTMRVFHLAWIYDFKLGFHLIRDRKNCHTMMSPYRVNVCTCMLLVVVIARALARLHVALRLTAVICSLLKFGRVLNIELLSRFGVDCLRALLDLFACGYGIGLAMGANCNVLKCMRSHVDLSKSDAC